LKPGDPAWTSDVKIKPGTVVKLFSPTGYDMEDSEWKNHFQERMESGLRWHCFVPGNSLL
jgi:hypothetical protein